MFEIVKSYLSGKPVAEDEVALVLGSDGSVRVIAAVRDCGCVNQHVINLRTIEAFLVALDDELTMNCLHDAADAVSPKRFE